MSPRAYYNEIEPYAAEWLRNLIREGLIADGDVDERDIRDVRPADLRGYTQCHFFAGIGVWSHALRLAGWPDDRQVWTGSCPCQPFSAAGKRAGIADERHLWPELFRLVRECRPPVVLGEQVASKDGLAWLDAVHTDLEGAGYAAAAVDLCAAGIGAPHIRQRLWWVALSAGAGPQGRERAGERADAQQPSPERGGAAGGVADDDREGRDRSAPARLHGRRPGASGDEPPARGADGACGNDADGRGDLGRLADDRGEGRRQVGADARGRGTGSRAQGLDERPLHGGPVGHASPLHGFWRDADWLLCRDGKWRPVEPGTFPLAHGAPARVGRLRAYGNAIVGPLAAEFCAEVANAIGVRLSGDVFG